MRIKKNHKNLKTEMFSIFVICASVFSIASLLSYHPKDPSFFTSTSGGAENLCGWVGSYFADLLFQVIGLGAFMIPAGLLFLASTIHLKEGPSKIIGAFGGLIISILALIVFLSLQWKTMQFGSTVLLTGGALGIWFAETLLGPFNALGASLISLGVFLISIVFSTPLSVSQFFGKLITHSWLYLVKGLKLISSASVYLVGVYGMKAAHGLGDLLQKTIENGVVNAKKRALAIGIAKREKLKEIELTSSSPNDNEEDHEPAFEFSSISTDSDLKIGIEDADYDEDYQNVEINEELLTDPITVSESNDSHISIISSQEQLENSNKKKSYSAPPNGSCGTGVRSRS